MPRTDETPFEKFTEEIFKLTYDKPSRALYYEECYNLRDSIQDAVIKLRKSYLPDAHAACEPFYHDEDCRKAYMFAYYPYFINPMQAILGDIVLPNLKLDKKLYLDCFACGPCPELLATARALKNYLPDEKNIKINVWAYDNEKEWFPYLKITNYFCNKLFDSKLSFFGDLDIKEHVEIFKNLRNATSLPEPLQNWKDRLTNKTQIVTLQNYLSHIDDDESNIKNFTDWLGNLAALTKAGTFFVLVDLNYCSTAKVFDKICGNFFLQKNSLNLIAKHIPDDGEPLRATHDRPSFGIRTNIFGEREFLNQPKKYTDFYFVVLQKK